MAIVKKKAKKKTPKKTPEAKTRKPGPERATRHHTVPPALAGIVSTSFETETIGAADTGRAACNGDAAAALRCAGECDEAAQAVDRLRRTLESRASGKVSDDRAAIASSLGVVVVSTDERARLLDEAARLVDIIDALKSRRDAAIAVVERSPGSSVIVRTASGASVTLSAPDALAVAGMTLADIGRAVSGA